MKIGDAYRIDMEHLLIVGVATSDSNERGYFSSWEVRCGRDGSLSSFSAAGRVLGPNGEQTVKPLVPSFVDRVEAGVAAAEAAVDRVMK